MPYLFTVIYSSQSIPLSHPLSRPQERLAGRSRPPSTSMMPLPGPPPIALPPCSYIQKTYCPRQEPQLPVKTNASRRPSRPPPGWTTATQDQGPRHIGVKPEDKQGKMTKEWLKYRVTILGLYKDQSKTLDEVRRIMKDEYGFDAS